MDFAQSQNQTPLTGRKGFFVYGVGPTKQTRFPANSGHCTPAFCTKWEDTAITRGLT